MPTFAYRLRQKTLERQPLGWRALGRTALVLLCSALAGPAAAHDPGLSSLDLSPTSSSIQARLSLSPRDAELAAGLTAHANADGTLTAEEWTVAVPRLEAFALEAIDLRAGDQRLTGSVDEVGLEGDATVFVSLRFAMPSLETRAIVTTDVPARLASGHRQMLTVRAANGIVQRERLLSARDGAERIALDVASSSLARARDFFVLGIEHILAGYDHLLFLAGLLLGVHRLRDVVATASAFTIGHSVTLACAVLGLASMPSAIVEPLIAASIVYVGVENLMANGTGTRWRTALPFGLIHGFGFAGALQELGVGTGPEVALPLGLFNLGVETGQVAVALLIWPMLQRLRASSLRMPSRLIPRACSGLVVACGAYWLVVRLG